MIEQTGIDLGLGVIRTITVRQIKRNTKPRVMSVGSFMYDQHDYREGLAACAAAHDLSIPVIVSFPFTQIWMTQLDDPWPKSPIASEQQYLATVAQHTWGVGCEDVRLDRVVCSPTTAFCIAARIEAITTLTRSVSAFFPHIRAIAVDAFALMRAMHTIPPEFCYVHDAYGQRWFQIQAGVPVRSAATSGTHLASPWLDTPLTYAHELNAWTICRGLATWGFTTPI